MSTKGFARKVVLLFVVNEAYFFMSHRLALAKAALASGFEVHVAAPSDHVWAPEGFSVKELSRAGFRFHRIRLSRRGTNPWRELVTLVALFRLYRRLRPDLVHHITIKPVLYGGLVARLLRVPATVILVTGLGQVFIGRGFRARLLRRAAIFGYQLATGHPNTRVIVQN